MRDVLTRDLVLYDPLTETTRKERRVLLGVSALGIALVKVPLVPTKFSALGLEFAPTNQAVLLTLYSLLVAYFLVGFLIYLGKVYKSAKFAAGLRALFEFLVPVGIAGYAVISVLLYKS